MVEILRPVMNHMPGKYSTLLLPSGARFPPSTKPYLEAHWDLATTYNWAYNPTYNSGNPNKPI